LSRYGNKSTVQSAKVSIINTDKLNETLEGNNIKLFGRAAEIWEFRVNQSDDSIVPYIVKRGVCSDPVWNDTGYYLPINDPDFKRNAPLGTLIDENYPNSTTEVRGDCVPVTFGELRPNENGSDGTYAKFIRTAAKETSYINITDRVLNVSENITLEMEGDNVEGLKIFPVVGNDGNIPPLTYKIKILIIGNNQWGWYKNDELQTTGKLNLSWFADKYIHVIEGTGQGKYRAIASAQVDLDVDQTLIELTVKDYFEETLVGNSTATAIDQSWVELVEIEREYSSDTWPCYAFLDLGGTEISTGLNLFSYTDEKNVEVSGDAEIAKIKDGIIEFVRLPQYAYKDTGSGNKNIIDIDVKLFRNNPDEMDSFLVLPAKSLSDINTNTLTQLGESDYTYVQEGLYKKHTSGGGYVWKISSITKTDKTNALDKDYSTYYEYKLLVWSQYFCWYTAFDIEPPTFPINFKYDNLYLGLKYYAKNVIANSDGLPAFSREPRFKAYWRRFIGSPVEIIDAEDLDFSGLSLTHEYNIISLPDEYYSSNPNLKNKYFYFEDDGSSSSIVSGFSAFEIDGATNKELYESIYRISIGMRFCTDYGVGPQMYGATESTIRLYEVAFMFRKSVSIKEAIYTPFKGRIYNSTWGARKTAANLIENPIDVLEHVLRCQNWSETGDSEPAAGWGKGYCASALIDTSTNLGGFDHPRLAALKETKCVRQILDYDKTYSDKLVQSICKEYFLCQTKKNYATVASGDAGKEMVINLFDETAPDTTITLANIIPGSIGDMQEPKAEDVYCEPFVRFCYNHARGKFDRIIKISHVSSDTWQASYTPGFSSGEGEYFYNQCSELYQKYGTIEPPPEDVTDLYWCYDYTTAKQYLSNLIRWMQLKRIQFDVDYETGRTWHCGKKIGINVPRQTGGIEIEAIIEAIEKNKNGNFVRCTYILLDNVSQEYFYIQDTWDTTTPSWQDTVDSVDTKIDTM
jgi:hypothetical protein